MVDRVEIAIIEDQPAALAGLPQRAVRPAGACRWSSPTSRRPTASSRRTWPSAACGLQRIVNPDRTLFYFNMEDPVVGGYTPEKVALRRAIGLATDVRARDQHCPARPGACRRRPIVAPGTWGYDAELQDREQRLRPGARQGAARPVRLRRPRRRRLARACPTARRWCWSTPPSPTRCRASSTSCGRRTWTRSALRLKIIKGAVARAAEDGARRPAS